MKQEVVYLYASNDVRAQIEAIGSFDLVLPNGLIIVLDNCRYAPTITRGVVLVSRLVDNGFVPCFTDYGILVSKNNVLYFNAIPRDGIYEVDMLNLVSNDNSIYIVSNKRSKHILDSTYLWHCRLAHIRCQFHHLTLAGSKNHLEPCYRASVRLSVPSLYTGRFHLVNGTAWNRATGFETYVKSKDINLWHIIVYGDYKPTIKNKDTGKEEVIPYENFEEIYKKMISKNDKAKMVLYNALPKKEYERIFMCKTAKDVWNSLIITHQESFSSRNHVREFLRALPTKWRSKVTKIEESKDLPTLPLDELIDNLKVYKVVLEKDSEASKIKKRGKFVHQPYDDKKNIQKVNEEKKGKEEQRCFKCGDPNHFISDCPKHSFNDQKAFVGGCLSDSEEEEDSKKDEICLMALDKNKVLFDTLYYSSSSLDSELLQNEYNKLCKISLRIINKNKLLKTKNEILDNKVCELKSRIERLEKYKEVSVECESCDKLHSKIESLSLKLAKFENSSHFLQEMIENQRT
ncbi:zf-CCHC domain-containing protein [Tanacetum coccineum]